MAKHKIVIMGAAGRDFHNFNCIYRDNEDYEVVAFTATQIPDIEGRVYPAKLAGKLYPEGIPIKPENELPEIIAENNIDDVVFSYSDVDYQYIMTRASWALASGAKGFALVGPVATMLETDIPVVAICAVRTGCGKSQTTRRVAEILTEAGKKVVVVRHPMPYGDLTKQICQRFETIDDLEKHKCTIEEMEEYEPHISRGNIVYAGVDYSEILNRAEKDADIILWDGGNNDTPFYRPDLMITVADPHRAGDEVYYYPGEINLRMADVVIINKVDTADYKSILEVRNNITLANPNAMIMEAASPISIEEPEMIFGKRVLVVEDGPTLTHGEMEFGAGVVAAMRCGASEFVDPHYFAVGTIAETFEKYPEVGALLPAMGYSKKQIADLEKTINSSDAEVVVIGTPIDLRRIVNIEKPSVRVVYDLQIIGKPNLEDVLTKEFSL
ncbi:GTPase [bacterium]|nr:MAG: GTPase [bacterium]